MAEGVGEKFGLELEFQHELIGGIGYDEAGSPLPDRTLAACEDAAAVFLGAVGGPGSGQTSRSTSVRNRGCSVCARRSDCSPT